VRDMVMQMSGSGGVLSVPDEHLPGLIVLVLIGPVIWIALAGLRSLAARRVGWADRTHGRRDEFRSWRRWRWSAPRSMSPSCRPIGGTSG
jgi:hypothetical protein